MVLTQEDYEKFMAAKRAQAQGEPPPKVPLNLLVKALIAGALSAVTTNLLSFLPQILITSYEYLTYSDEYIGASVFYLVWNVLRLFIYGAFTKAIKKIIHRDKENATQASNVQDTIVLPFVAATARTSADDLSDVNEEIAGEAFQSNKAELPTAIMGTSISRSQTVRDSHLSNKFETRELGTQIAIVEPESKLTSAPLVDQIKQKQSGKSYESAFYTKGGTLSREAAKALKERAAAAVNALSKAHAQLSPFMWLGRFTALLLSSVRFAVYGSATAVYGLQEKQPVTASLIFNDFSAVKYDQDLVTL
ncbi:hypothetical protein HDV05_007830, partial [Chytridiales sp. JEL 0842]